MDLNKIMLIARSTAEISVKKIESSGFSVVNFTVVTNRKYKNTEWLLVAESEYHRCTAYGVGADILGKYLTKGKRIYIEGRLKTRKRQDSTGQDRRSTEVIVTDFIFLDHKGEEHDDVIPTLTAGHE